MAEVIKKKKNDNILKKVVQGRLVSFNFFIKHWVMITLALVIAVVYISTKYTCQMRMQKIISLSNELNNVKTDYVKASSEFKSQTRETRMRDLIDTTKVNLTAPDQPPYKLSGK